VGRHGLGDGAGGAADAEKSARDFLARANLCKRPVLGRIEIDLQRLSVGADFDLWSHTISLAMIAIAANPGLLQGVCARRLLRECAGVWHRRSTGTATIALARRSSRQSTRANYSAA